jgi:hypothetical protein
MEDQSSQPDRVRAATSVLETELESMKRFHSKWRHITASADGLLTFLSVR